MQEPTTFTAVLDLESVIRRAVGGSTGMREQLEVLVPLIDTSRPRFRVAPFSRGAQPLSVVHDPSYALRWGACGLPRRCGANGQLIEDPDSVRALRWSYDSNVCPKL